MQGLNSFLTTAGRLGETAIGMQFARQNQQDLLASNERTAAILAGSQERQTSQIVTAVLVVLGLSMIMKKARG